MLWLATLASPGAELARACVVSSATGPDSAVSRSDPAAPDSATGAPDSAMAAPAPYAGPLKLTSPSAAVPDTTTRRAKPFLVMARSATLPGWGQVYNRQPLKAALVVAGEGYLISRIFTELKRENEAIDRQNAATTPEEFEAAAEDELIHKNRKVDWIWWTAAGHLLQMADAYVDAHFIHFDAEFGPDERSGSRDGPRMILSLNVRF